MTSKAECPICGKSTDPKYLPFCSKRCADVDLNRWLSGGYAVPGSEDDSEGNDEMPLSGDPSNLRH